MVLRQPAVLPGVRGQVGEAGELRVLVRPAVFLRLVVEGRVGGEERDQQVERAVLHGIQELQRAVGHQVGLVALQLLLLTVVTKVGLR